jgi:hypothetical protein
VLSGTTVGYGDVSPHTPRGRWATVLWLPLSVVWVGGQLSRVGSCVFGDENGGKLEKLLQADLSLEVNPSIVRDRFVGARKKEPLVQSRRPRIAPPCSAWVEVVGIKLPVLCVVLTSDPGITRAR